MGYISEKDRLYFSFVTELHFNRILLDALNLKRDTLYKEQSATWKRYTNYLLNWSDAHQDPECFGSSPADFDEWKSWERPEDEEEVGGYYFDDFGNYILAENQKLLWNEYIEYLTDLAKRHKESYAENLAPMSYKDWTGRK
jgi:hypothetical protein